MFTLDSDLTETSVGTFTEQLAAGIKAKDQLIQNKASHHTLSETTQAKQPRQVSLGVRNTVELHGKYVPDV